MIVMRRWRAVLCGVSFRRILRSSEEVQYGELLSILSNVFLYRNSKGSFVNFTCDVKMLYICKRITS